MAWRAARVLAAMAWLGGCLPATSGGNGDGGAASTPVIVSLTFDDGFDDVFAAREILASHRMSATFYIISGKVDSPGYLTRAQVEAIYSDGHEIGGHTLTHPDLTTVTTDEARRQICDDRQALLDWGYRVQTFAYPYGAENHAIEGLALGCGYSVARTVGGIITGATCASCSPAESLPPRDPEAARTPGSIKVDTSLDDMRGYVEQAERSNLGGVAWVPIVMHHVCDGCSDLAVSPSTLSAFLDWLGPRSQRGTIVETVERSTR
jgi:peptidoglycan/xylan/chitin deacetylase (PgdA/CDA1 family)